MRTLSETIGWLVNGAAIVAALLCALEILVWLEVSLDTLGISW